MDVVGSEIGQKMRSAIKAKLTELGCYVDDELPDYVMVMVANKRTRDQMEDDLQLFLGDNTILFVNWLHQVLKKLQEVTVTAPAKIVDPDKNKEKGKEKKSKEKKIKTKDKEKLKKTGIVKKTKKKDKEKTHKKKEKETKKGHKSKKKSKHKEIMRPNVPPLLMNMEKESEPSITDVFAGQILKNHGIVVETPKEEKQVDKKPIVNEIKRPLLPIIDPATISSQPELSSTETAPPTEEPDKRSSVSSVEAPRAEQIKEMNEIEAKIQGLKQKLVEQLDSMSDDEDFLNIRTEAEDLMNDFAEDVFQEISSQAEAPVATPPIVPEKFPSPPKEIVKPPELVKEATKESSTEPENPSLDPKKPSLDPEKPPLDTEKPPLNTEKPFFNPEKPSLDPKEPFENSLKELPETLPQIELKLPKRPVRERLGAKQALKVPEKEVKDTEKRKKSSERLTPEKEPDFWGKARPARIRISGPTAAPAKRASTSDDSDLSDSDSKKVTSKVSVSERPLASTVGRCASVVRVRPRARVAPASGLLLRAVADAHKSLLNIPPKPEHEQPKIKRALVLPMRRCVDAQKIVIQVPRDNSLRRNTSHVVNVDNDEDTGVKPRSDYKEENHPKISLSRRFQNTEDTPRRPERTTSRKDDTLVIETINIHNTTVDKDKDTQFIVTMDGFNPNSFLAKKLLTEGILNEEEEPKEKSEAKLEKIAKPAKSVLRIEKVIDDNAKEKIKEMPADGDEDKANRKTNSKTPELPTEKDKIPEISEKTETRTKNVENKRLSNTSDESDTQVIINPEETKTEKRKNIESKSSDSSEDAPPVKKRRASPIVFDVGKIEKAMELVKEKEKKPVKERERTESASSDNNHVTVTTIVNAHKYDAVPSLSAAEKKVVPCRWFPLCRYGGACAYQHPRCKFAAACTRRNCIYSHAAQAAPAAVVASHVVPTANFKSISAAVPGVCKFYPSCVNPACRFHHPKPCRYGAACANKLDCNFYHADVPLNKWRYPV